METSVRRVSHDVSISGTCSGDRRNSVIDSLSYAFSRTCQPIVPHGKLKGTGDEAIQNLFLNFNLKTDCPFGSEHVLQIDGITVKEIKEALFHGSELNMPKM